MSQQTSSLDGDTADRIEDIIDTAQDHLDDAEDLVDDVYHPDLEDIEERIEELEDAIDDAQDDEDENPLGPVPAVLDYTQWIVMILEEETDSDALDDLASDLEVIEEELDDVTISQTRWLAIVNGIPTLFDEEEVSPNQLKEAGDIDGKPDDYSLHVLRTPSDDVDDSMMTIPPKDSDPVDLGEERYFKTEKVQGGVV